MITDSQERESRHIEGAMRAYDRAEYLQRARRGMWRGYFWGLTFLAGAAALAFLLWCIVTWVCS